MTSASPAILLVDDEPQFLLSSGVMLRSAGISPVLTVGDSRAVMPLLAEKEVGVIVLDLTMPHLTGTELLSKIKEEHPQIPVIVLTGTNEVETAVACMKAGAIDYLVKPVEISQFVSSVRRAAEIQALRDEVFSLKRHLLSEALENEDAFAGILTTSKKMHAIFRYVEAIGRSSQPVLVTGETGTGKELIARAVHDLSGCRGSFIAVNVAGLDDPMFSDTLFGHKRGAYTGADAAREGLIAKAAGGTLFLDEIGDLKESSQVKLLRLLEEKKYYALGSDVPRESDARIVCATHQNLQERVGAGRFRKDLYYRLSAHHVHIPPLRERLEDLPVLVEYFLEEAGGQLQKKKPTAPSELITFLSTYHFPGNVRELKTMILDAVVQHKSGILSMESFRRTIGSGQDSPPLLPGVGTGEPNRNAPFTLHERFPSLRETEEFLISEALRRARNNQGIAASLLGISRQALNKRLIRTARSDKSPE